MNDGGLEQHAGPVVVHVAEAAGGTVDGRWRLDRLAACGQTIPRLAIIGNAGGIARGSMVEMENPRVLTSGDSSTLVVASP